MGSTRELVRRSITDQALASPGCSVSSGPQTSSCLALRSQGRWEAKKSRIRPAWLWVKPRSGADTGPCKRARRWLGQGQGFAVPNSLQWGQAVSHPHKCTGPLACGPADGPTYGAHAPPQGCQKGGHGGGSLHQEAGRLPATAPWQPRTFQNVDPVTSLPY